MTNDQSALANVRLQTYWLEKNALGQWSKVILVFGYPQNQDACHQLVVQQRQIYPLAGYRCTHAN